MAQAAKHKNGQKAKNKTRQQKAKPSKTPAKKRKKDNTFKRFDAKTIMRRAHMKRWRLKQPSEYGLDVSEDIRLDPIYSGIEDFNNARIDVLQRLKIDNLDELDLRGDVVDSFINQLDEIIDNIDQDIDGELSDYEEELTNVREVLEAEREHLEEHGTFLDDTPANVRELTRLTDRERELYYEKQEMLEVMLDQMDQNNLIAINDKHENREPFEYATLLIKLANRRGIKGTFMVEGPYVMNNWTPEEFVEEHTKWNLASGWKNTFQADAAAEALRQGWEVKTVDDLPVDESEGMYTHHGIKYGDAQRQIDIGDKIQGVIDNSSEDNKGKVLVLGTGHVIGSGPYSKRRGAGNISHLLGTLFKISPDTKESTKRSRFWVVDVAKMKKKEEDAESDKKK